MRKVISGLLASLLLVCSLPSPATGLEVMVFAPDHVGLTMLKSPALYFFASHATSLPVRFTLIDDRAERPVAEALLKSPSSPGIQEIQLREYDIVLEPDVQYRWFISIIRDPESRAQDIVAGGAIERCDFSTCMFIYENCSKATVVELAKSGIWYDSVSCLCKLIKANPDDQGLWQMLRNLQGISQNPLLVPLEG